MTNTIEKNVTGIGTKAQASIEGGPDPITGCKVCINLIDLDIQILDMRIERLSKILDEQDRYYESKIRYNISSAQNSRKPEKPYAR